MIQSFGTPMSGLKSSQIAIDNTMNNIANENTPGYVKQVANFAEISNGDFNYSNGVEVSEIERQANEYLMGKLITQYAMESYYNEASNIYGLTETYFKETETSGLSYDLNNYFQSIENLKSDPNNEIYKNELISTSNTLVEGMQSIYTDLNEQQASLEKQVYEDVESVNNIINQISDVNADIQEFGEDPALLNKRDNLEKELSQYVDIEVEKGDNYELKIAGETAVFNNTTTYEMEVVDSSTAQKNVDDDPILNDSALTDGETITVKLNNGQSLDITVDTTGASDSDVKQQVADAINADASMNKSVRASVDDKGNLIVESRTVGENASFDLQIELADQNSVVSPSSKLSKEATDDIHIEVLDERLELNSGSLKATTENLQTNNPNNTISQAKQDLDDLAYALSDMYSSYAVNSDGSYVYGDDATATHTGEVNEVNLFSGSSVMSMSVNEEAIDDLSLTDLEYLSTLQWKDDMSISSTNGSQQSFSEFYQTTRVDVSSTKENMDFKTEAQTSIVMSLQSTYDQATKVDLDEETVNLMQYQAAYEANAKVITALDEMIQTILNM